MKNYFISPLKHIVGAVLFVLFDICAVVCVYGLALYVSFGCESSCIPAPALQFYLKSLPLYLIASVVVYRCVKMYDCIWSLISYHELFVFTTAAAATAAGYFAVLFLLDAPLPLRYYVIGGWLQISLVVPARFAYRILLRMWTFFRNVGNDERKRILLIGAGSAGQAILRNIAGTADAKLKVCCIVDDNPSKHGCTLEGVPVIGGRDVILAAVKKYHIDEIFLAIPSIDSESKKQMLEICKESGCKLKILPGLSQLMNEEVSLAKMKNVSVEDLLGRPPIKIDTEQILQNLSGRVILVTGGGGSIGSELCRQIASHNPKQLIIFDIYENNAYDIEQELRRTFPELNLAVLIGSVRDTMRVLQVFRKYRPEIVFHAAAHKHVPLMENSPCESIKNNVLGTYKTAYAALCCGCRRFVLISTDKAVNPTNIMGASKRICEMVIQGLDQIRRNGRFDLLPDVSRHGDWQECFSFSELEKSQTEFVAVRFGNVLGSNGSVIPLFKKQLESGGPLTVTHPDIIRYFMTIPEAVSLVLQAETFAKGGEIFVLDMGEPVKIDTLARNFIKLSGYKPDVDIRIEYIGLRPGEKLYEEKLMAEEGLSRTENKLIHIARPLNFNVAELMESLKDLSLTSYDNPQEILSLVKKLVSTYQPKI